MLVPRISVAAFSVVVFFAPPSLANEQEAEHKLTEFASTAGIDFWPALKICAYAEAFGNRRAGLLLTVINGRQAQARWDGSCRAPVPHEISGWPDGLPPGDYIVSARADTERNSGHPAGNRHLRIDSVFQGSAASGTLLRMFMRRVCAVPEARLSDRHCREPN